MANKRAADRLAEKYIFEAEAAYLTKELAKKKNSGGGDDGECVKAGG